MHYELVKVINRTTLLNPVQIECPYRTPGGRPLVPGIYSVTWSKESQSSKYDSDARYHGPFRSWRAAGDYAGGLARFPSLMVDSQAATAA